MAETLTGAALDQALGGLSGWHKVDGREAIVLQDAFLDPSSPGDRTVIHTDAGGDTSLTGPPTGTGPPSGAATPWGHPPRCRRSTAYCSSSWRFDTAAAATAVDPWKVPGKWCTSTDTPASRRRAP